MARGWESKSVEEQISSAAAAAAPVQRLTPEQLERRSKRDSLLLERTRVIHDLDTAQNPRYQQMLKLALAHLDSKLAELA